jgi:hypothetical protein
LDHDRGQECSKRFPSGYAIFSITQSKEIIPMRILNRGVEVDWKNSYCEMTRNEMTLTLSKLKFLNASADEATKTLPREVGAISRIYAVGSQVLEVTIVSFDSYVYLLVLGVGTGEGDDTWPPRNKARFKNLRFD